jgi:hypothetical protein
MTYPQYPQYPQNPGYTGAIAPEPRAGGGLAITAGVLAMLGALTTIGTGIGGIQFISSPDLPTIVLAGIIVDWVVALTLLVGSVLLLMRKSIGQILVITGCSLTLALSVMVGVGGGVALSDAMKADGQTSSNATGAIAGVGFFAFLMALPAIITLVFALVPTTSRWIKQGKAPAQQPQLQPYQAPQQW